MIAAEDNTIMQVKAFIDKEIPINARDKVLIGLSGGADSVALLSVMKRLKYDCIAAHCNFSLRGKEAIRDRNFAAETAKTHNIPFIDVTFNTLEYVAAKNISVEMACRELRYEWFEKECLAQGCRYIAVAHHRDDSVETLLINLIRGTGISGLTGISPVNGNIIRPMLCLSRIEIEAYLSSRGLNFVTDSTNSETVYVRNKVRNILLPLMQSINPAVYSSLERTAANLRDAELLYREALKEAINRIVTYDIGKVYISVKSLISEPASRSVLYEIIKQYGFMPAQLDPIIAVLNKTSGLRFFSATHRIVKDRETLIISPLLDEDDTILHQAEDVLNIEYIDNEGDYELGKDRTTVYFDADKLKTPLYIRHWHNGDRFIPFGMSGSQKLSDYFNNHKFTLIQKEEAQLLLAGEDIIWIVGERQSDKYKVVPATKKILKISVKKI
ncbi:MAG: tRNA lysidine(34) synthetase TilS [Bacteroidales bacterium]